VVNGITMAPLMKYLKMTEVSEARKMMLNGSFAKLRQATEHCLHELHTEATFFKDVDWSEVVGVDLGVFYHDIHDVPKAAWLSVLSIERASYERQYHEGLLTRDGFFVLESFMAKMAADAAKVDSQMLQERYEHHFKRLMTKLKKRISSEEIMLPYHVSKAYITGQLDVKHSMELYKKEVQADVDATGEGEAQERHRARRAAVDAMAQIQRQHTNVLDGMRDLLYSIGKYGERASFADEASVLQGSIKSTGEPEKKDEFAREKTRYAANLLLLEQRHVVEHLLHEGLLDALDAAPLIKEINEKIEQIMLAPLVDKFAATRKQPPRRRAQDTVVVAARMVAPKMESVV